MMQPEVPVARRHVAVSGGRTIRVMGDRVTYKAVAEQTGGAYSLFEFVVEPGPGVPPHHGRYEDETFWILEGEFRLRLDDETLELGPGGYAYAPRGTVHALANVGDVPGRLLVLVTPGGLRERFIDEMGGSRGVPEALTGSADIERAAAIAAKYGTELLFPPPPSPDPRAGQQGTPAL